MSEFDVQEAILAVVRGAATTYSVVEGAESDEAMRVVVDNSGLQPQVVMNFTGLYQAGRSTKHITGAAYNSGTMQTIVQVVADTDRTARKVMSFVKGVLTGYEPPNSGELDIALYGASGKINFLGSPTRYSAVQAFVCIVNSDKE